MKQTQPDPSRIELEIVDYQRSDKVVKVDTFEAYDLPSSMMQAADQFHFAFAATDDVIETLQAPGQVVRVYVDGLLQLTGIVDSAPITAGPDGLRASISGRDFGALLVDAVPQMMTLTNTTLEAVLQKLTAPWSRFISGIVTDNEANAFVVSGKNVGRTAKKFSGLTKEKKWITRTRPEDRVWDLLVQLAQQAGCHLWMTARGEVCCARPNYSADPSVYGDGLFVLTSGSRVVDSNCRIEHAPSISQRSSHYTVLGQGVPSATANGKSISELAYSCKDPSPAFHFRSATALTSTRLEKIAHQSVREIDNLAHVRHVARSRMQMRATEEYKMKITTHQHRLFNGAPLWSVDTQVRVRFGPRKIDGVHYIVGRTFHYTETEGQTTELHVIPSGIWLADLDLPDSEYESKMLKAIQW